MKDLLEIRLYEGPEESVMKVYYKKSKIIYITRKT